MTHAPLSRRTLLTTATGLAAAGFVLPSFAFAQTPPQNALETFRFKGWKGEETDAERGSFEVPENRRDPASRRIKLTYVRFRSTATRPGPPIVYLAGGPGGTATGTATGPRFPIFMALREVADVIAFDQRGTGDSNPIPPRPLSKDPVPAFTHEGLTAYFRSEFRAAWDDWTRAGVSMAGYNTAENADDIDDLRRHLGAEKIDLWGISYGSHLGLSVLKRHGDRVRRIALASLEGQDQTVKSPAHLDAYLRRVDALIDGQPELRAAVPDLLALMRRVHARMEADPVVMTLPVGGVPTPVRIGGFAIQLMAGGMIANPQTLALLPGLYLALDAGQTQVLAPIFGDLGDQLMIGGMPEAMDLASGISPGRRVQLAREARTAVLGDALNFPMPHLLGVVPGADLGEAFRSPLRIDHEALLVHGTLDGRTPLEEQAEVAAQFRRKSRVFVENAGHNVFEAHPQVQTLLVKFFKGEAVADTRLTAPAVKFRMG